MCFFYFSLIQNVWMRVLKTFLRRRVPHSHDTLDPSKESGHNTIFFCCTE